MSDTGAALGAGVVVKVFGTQPTPLKSYTHIHLTNNSPVDVWLGIVARGAAAPAPSSTSNNGRLLAGESKIFPFGGGIDVYLKCSSGAGNYSAVALLLDGTGA